MKRTNITPEQDKVLSVIEAHHALYGEMPTLAYIQKKLNYAYPSSVQHHVVALRERGLLDFSKQEQKVREIPLIGIVPTGPAFLAEENIEAYVPVPENQLKSKSAKYFFLRAEGDSMNRAKIDGVTGIQNGDYILVRQQEDAKTGDIIVALMGDDATCKKLGRTNDGFPLLIPESSNPVHKPRVMLENFSVLGIVENIVRPLRRAHV